MMNNEECFFNAVSELENEHFNDAVTNSLFQYMSGSSSRMTKNMLLDKIQEPRLKAAVSTFDGSWSGKEDFDYSLDKLKEINRKRNLFHTIKKAENIFDDSSFEEISEILSNDLVAESETDDESIIDSYERAPIALDEFYQRVNDPDAFMGLPFSTTNERGQTRGLPSLDHSFNGAKGGDLIMIAAKTGIGKTAFAVNLTRHLSLDLDYTGYYMNTEMRVEELESRLLAHVANVEADEILTGRLQGTNDEQEQKIKRINIAYDRYMKSNLVLSRIPDLPLHKAKGLAKQVKSKFKKLDYIIVDYVGRMEIKDNQNQNTWDELYKITQQLKELAMLLDIPIFMLAQRNEAGYVEGAKKMRNECDGVLYLEPIEHDEVQYLETIMHPTKAQIVNYKIVKNKVRRSDNPYPIYVLFDKSKNFINEVTP